jgi:hypothetical protein
MVGASFLALGLAAQTPSPDAPAPTGAPLAVLPLRAEDLQLNEVVRLDGLLRDAGAKAGYVAQSPQETTALLEAAQALGVQCDLGVPACGAEVGRAAAVDRIVVGHAALVAAGADHPGGVGIEASLVDANNGATLRHVTALLPREPDAQRAAFDAVARGLFDAAPGTSWLVVTGAPAGATISVDGIDIGALPLGRPVTGAVAGVHVVAARAHGYLPWVRAVTSAPGEPALVDVALRVDPAAQKEVVSPLQVGLVWGLAGTGAALAVGGAVTAAIGSQPWFAYSAANDALRSLQAGPDQPAQAARLHADASDAADAWASWGSPTTIAGAVIGGLGLVAGAGGVVWALSLPDEEDATTPPPSSTTTAPVR